MQEGTVDTVGATRKSTPSERSTGGKDFNASSGDVSSLLQCSSCGTTLEVDEEEDKDKYAKTNIRDQRENAKRYYPIQEEEEDYEEEEEQQQQQQQVSSPAHDWTETSGSEDKITDVVKTVSEVLIKSLDKPPTSKYKRGKRTNGPSFDMHSLQSTLKHSMDILQTWRYISISYRSVKFHSCRGEIIKLYEDVASLYPNQPLRPWWTVFMGAPVLVCYDTTLCPEGETSNRDRTNKIANSWLPQAEEMDIALCGNVVIVPMTQSDWNTFRKGVKALINSKSKSRRQPA